MYLILYTLYNIYNVYTVRSCQPQSVSVMQAKQVQQWLWV